MLMFKLHKVSLMSDGSLEMETLLTSRLEDFNVINQAFKNPVVRRENWMKGKAKNFQVEINREVWSGIKKKAYSKQEVLTLGKEKKIISYVAFAKMITN